MYKIIGTWSQNHAKMVYFSTTQSAGVRLRAGSSQIPWFFTFLYWCLRFFTVSRAVSLTCRLCHGPFSDSLHLGTDLGQFGVEIELVRVRFWDVFEMCLERTISIIIRLICHWFPIDCWCLDDWLIFDDFWMDLSKDLEAEKYLLCVGFIRFLGFYNMGGPARAKKNKIWWK